MILTSFNIYKKVFFILSLLLFISPFPAFSSATIKALVNDEPITAYDVEQRAKFTRLAARKTLNNALRKQTLEELIDEKLKIQMARDLGITPDYNAAEQQFAAIAARSKLSPSKFEQLIRRSGVNPSTFKDRIAVEIMWNEIVSQRFRRDIGTRRQELTSIIEEQGGSSETEEIEYDLAQVIVIAPGGTKSSLNSAQKTARQIQANISSCSQGRQYLQSIKNAIYKPIGARRASELQPNALKQIQGLSVGQVSSIETGKAGLEMVIICSQRNVKTEGIIDKNVENQVLSKEFDILGRRLIRDMRQDAVIEYK